MKLTILQIIFLSRLRREPLARRSQIFQIFTNHTNYILKIIERFVRFLSRSDTPYYYSLNSYQ